MSQVDELLVSGAARPTTQASRAVRRDSMRRRALAVADVAALALAYLSVQLIQPSPEAWTSEHLVLLGALPLWVLINKLLGLYDSDANLIHKSTLNELPQITQSVLLGAALVFLLTPLFLDVDVGRVQTILFSVAAIGLQLGLRFAVRHGARGRLPVERCLILGSGPVAETVARKIQSHPEYGATVVGFADLEQAFDEEPEAAPAFPLEDVADLERVCRENGVERVILAFPWLSPDKQLEAIQASKLLDLKISVVPRLFEVTGHSVEVDQVEGMTLLGLGGFSRTRSSLFLKRSLDVAVAVVGLIALAPLFAVLAVAIKASSSGPVFYRQERIGRHNRPFRLVKLRTMVDGADELKPSLVHLNEAARPMFKIADDPRVTRLGRRLRRMSIDELPQLWNVLKGEMSLVGPRPLVPAEDSQVVGWHRERLKLTPGLTGPWQVLGRTSIPFEEMVKLDYLYVAEWSLWNDVKLLVRTAPIVVLARGH